MKQTTRFLGAAALTAALLVGGSAALAAEEGGVSVQLNGETLTFTDAVPQVVEQRTFLPFRAVFEAMGAKVSSEGDVITAARDGQTLTMTIGSPQVIITEGEEETVLEMDVAPYVDTETWRTYVPVRFAAQALGCTVGWDQDNATVILVDPDRLADKVTEGKSYTYLEKLAAYGAQYEKGVWNAELNVKGSLTLLTVPVDVTAKAESSVSDGEKMAVNMDMKLDLSQLMSFAAALGSEENEDSAALADALLKDGVQLDLRGDTATGDFYCNVALPEALQSEDWDSSAWYSLNLADLADSAGADWQELLEVGRNMTPAGVIKAALSQVELTDTQDYAQLEALLQRVAAALSDDGFMLWGGSYAAILDETWGDTRVFCALSFPMKDDKAAGYSIDLGMESKLDEETTLTLEVSLAMDDNGQMEAQITGDLGGGVLGMDLAMTGSYTAGEEAPEVVPPTGVTVQSLTDLLGTQL